MGERERPIIVWFRQDLRVDDNPALKAAVDSKRPVVPIYLLDDESEGRWKPGGASRWWLHHALADLQRELTKRGVELLIRVGDSREQLEKLLDETDAEAVYWNRRYEPRAIERDRRIKARLKKRGIEAKSYNGSLLFEPREVANKSGQPYKVFTPYWKACLQKQVADAQTLGTRRVLSFGGELESEKLDSLGLLPRISWDEGFYEAWDPTQSAARKRLNAFLKGAATDYHAQRNLPAADGTSRLSPYLHFGQISPRQIWTAFRNAELMERKGVRVYLSEIGWREFSYHLLYHFPETTEEPLRPEFEAFEWEENDEHFEAWKRGQTGYPFVDAAMRQLWTTGWMHNRVRMVVASFLVKHLRQHWLKGAEWFWDTLVDADLANNTQGWQWTAGSGADAAPYFRVFNPFGQGQRFDEKGDFTRRWVPELAPLSDQELHTPWEASEASLEQAGISLGSDYPKPIVDHKEARQAALASYHSIKGKGS